MSVEIGRYQFHSWARRGIARNIGEADDLGAGSSTTVERAQISLGVSLNAAGFTKQFVLLGPGDVIGVNRDMVVRTEPLSWVTDFESNYLAFIEFYDEDFAWRYTPAAPAGNRLRPWLFLLILKEDEFERTKRRLPLSSIQVKTAAAFPSPTETWLWAHVHSNADIPDSELSEYEKFLRSLNKAAGDNPDQLYCRLLSPRKLEPQTPYYAFLIPAFEAGRLAGLDQPTDTALAQMASWAAPAGARGEMPFYYEWFFRTGANADFESLVRKLEPRPMSPTIGIRDMDCSRPGFVTAEGNAELPGTRPAIIGLEGALKSPDTQSTVFPSPSTETAFQQQLQRVVNLPFEVVAGSTAEDPVLSLPLYGGKHAKKNASDVVKLDVTKQVWVQDLNRDPRWRVSAGLGTSVVQTGQEEFMRKAWAQAKSVLEANEHIRRTLFYMQVAVQFTRKTVSAMPQAKLLGFAKPLLSKVLGSQTTVLHQIGESRVPSAVLSASFRKLIRPRSKFSKKLDPLRTFDYGKVVQGLNKGDIKPALERTVPKGVPSVLTLGRAAVSTGTTPSVASVARRALDAVISRVRTTVDAGEALTSPDRIAKSVREVPARPQFSLVLGDEDQRPDATVVRAGADSLEATNYRQALVDFSKRLAVQVPAKQFAELDVNAAYAKVQDAIHPYKAFPRRLSRVVKFPGYIPVTEPAKVFEAMAYPDFENAMYKGLVDISGDLLLPNMKEIPVNTISLLKTNPKFIESYLVGLNHEMGRELLWREYPTDERGSYFRQFWEVKGLIRPAQGKSEAQLAEAAKDIKPIHTWVSDSLLGGHNNRAPVRDGSQTVLILRGDLLKRYPNTVIFAQKAIPGTTADESLIDTDLTTEEFNTQLMFPIYRAELPPDIKLFGFPLTIEQAKGTELSPGFDDHLGWFFAVQEIPGEPRFGMDITFDPGSDGLSWDDLAWDRLAADTKFITAGALPNIAVPDQSRWGTDSASMAYVLFQKPNLVVVHASEMLAKVTDQPS